MVCVSDYHRFCTRGIYSFWREIWLERVDEQALNGSSHSLSPGPGSRPGRRKNPRTPIRLCGESASPRP
jgi:hypothetical protein